MVAQASVFQHLSLSSRMSHSHLQSCSGKTPSLFQVHASLSLQAALPGLVLLGTSLCPQALLAIGCIQLTVSGGTAFLMAGF